MKGEYKFLLDLINAFGVSGKEAEVRALLTKELKGTVDRVYTDKMGNLIAHKKGKSPRVMFAAHMDEIGLIVKNIESDGKIRIATIGGIDEIVVLNEKVEIRTRKGAVRGVVTTNDISASRITEKKPLLYEMFIDAGLSKSELIKRGVHIGSFITFASNAEILGNGKVVSGKALDDRIGCYILTQLAKKVKNLKNEVFFVFTVQEEVGLYGAKTSSFVIEPDWAVAIDVTDCDDCEKNSSKALGNGPTLTIKDEEMISNPCIDDQILDLAKKHKIKLQPDVSEGGTTDAINISISKGGVPTAVVGVPVRGLHSPIGLASLSDIENAIRILALLLKDPPDICVG